MKFQITQYRYVENHSYFRAGEFWWKKYNNNVAFKVLERTSHACRTGMQEFFDPNETVAVEKK